MYRWHVLTAGVIVAALWGAVAEAGRVSITVDANTRYQSIDGWGASLIFWDRMAGPDSPYHDPAFIDAYARGMGCNILRIQCSPHAFKGPSGRLDDPVELGPDLDANIAKFDFEHSRVRIFGQVAQYLRDNAREPEAVEFMADFWTPPHWMKEATGETASFAGRPARPTPFVTWQGSDTVGGTLKQTPENLEQFARYVAAWTKGFERHYGITFDNISLQNEISFENPFDSCTYLHRLGPDRDGDGQPDRQAGQYWQYAAALKAVKNEFARLGITTRIRGPHMANIGEDPGNPWALNDQCGFIGAVKEHADPDLDAFLSIYTSNGYIGRDAGAVMFHAFREGKDAIPDRDWADWLYCPGFGRDGKPYWISEGAAGVSDDWLGGGRRGIGGGAIVVAQKLHNALVWGNVSAYVYWQALDGGRERPSGGHLLGNTFDLAGGKACAFRHFSGFVRPGAVRVKTTPTAAGGSDEMDTSNSINVSAYVHDADRTVTIVFVNMRPERQDVTVAVPDWPAVSTCNVWQTTSEESFVAKMPLRVDGGRMSLSVPGHAVVTLHGQG